MITNLLDRLPESMSVPTIDRVSTPGTKLSVIVPAYREAHRIQMNLRRLITELDKLETTYEVIVVSDGNTDETAREVERVLSPCLKLVEYAKNMGKGYALRCGVSHSSGELVTFIDADMELDPRYIKPFLAIMEGLNCDGVIGSKRHPMSQVHYPWFRRVQSALYQILIRLLFHLKLKDTQTGLKLFRRKVLSEVVPLLAVKRFAFDLELLVVARYLGYRRILEAPIELDYQFESTVDPAAVWHVLWDTAAIFYRLHVKRYYGARRRDICDRGRAQAEAE